MIIKTAILGLLGSGVIGLAHGMATPKYSGTNEEMSYGKGALKGAKIVGGIGAVGGGIAGLMYGGRMGHSAVGALGGALGGGLYGGLAGGSAILGTRLGRGIKHQDHPKSFKKHKK